MIMYSIIHGTNRVSYFPLKVNPKYNHTKLFTNYAGK